MREPVDAERVRAFLRRLAAAAEEPTRAYLTGGTTAVLLGLRASTIDVDLALVPETDRLLRALSALKDELRLNVELVAPSDFVPVPAGWEERALFVLQEGKLAAYHYDPYSQALAKVERGHGRDLADVRALVGAGQVDPARLRGYFDEVEPQLYRYPAVDPPTFRLALEQLLAELG